MSNNGTNAFILIAGSIYIIIAATASDVWDLGILRPIFMTQNILFGCMLITFSLGHLMADEYNRLCFKWVYVSAACFAADVVAIIVGMFYRSWDSMTNTLGVLAFIQSAMCGIMLFGMILHVLMFYVLCPEKPVQTGDAARHV